MKIKNVFVLSVFIVSILAFCGIASALQATIDSVKLDNDILQKSATNQIRGLDKGDEFEVKIAITALSDAKNVQMEAEIFGYDYEDRIGDTSDVFDVKNGTTYVKKMTLKFPERMDRDRYKLRVTVADRNGDTIDETYDLSIDATRHSIVIKDVVLSPNNGVKSGRALLATVRVQNYGSADEENVKVSFTIPELGISASDYIDTLENDGSSDDAKSTEQLYLRIPPCAKAGVYDADVEVRYHDGEKTVRKTMTVEVLSDETCEVAPAQQQQTEGKAVVSIGPEAQDVTRGAGGAVYPVTITNTGSSKTFVISVTGGDWGTFRVSPTNVLTVGKGETKVAYIYVSANQNAPAGNQIFGVDIKTDDKVVQSVTLKANVVGQLVATGINLKRALEIGLIVLVVILVILGLIIGFNKLKDKDEDKEDGQNYY